jgi:hypothetical protein
MQPPHGVAKKSAGDPSRLLGEGGRLIAPAQDFLRQGGLIDRCTSFRMSAGDQGGFVDRGVPEETDDVGMRDDLVVRLQG